MDSNAEEVASSSAGGGNLNLEEGSMKDVTDPRETDVLCGRGGAALRHPGNQTYRRLVNLNKGLYITCLKTEKLKISRSIVAAIREQNGRFLERDANKGTWFDIGDKKAIEKTSQALREGQPKLRQKMVEMGGGAAAAVAAATHPTGPAGLGMDNPNQFGTGVSNGVFNHPGMQTGGTVGGFDPSPFGMQMTNPHMPAPQHTMGGATTQDMPPPPSRGMNDMNSDLMLQRLSLASNDESRSFKSRLRPPINNIRGTGGISDQGVLETNTSLMSFGNNNGDGTNESNVALGASELNSALSNGMSSNSQPPPPPMIDISPSVRSMDRRRLFAKMKFSHPASARNMPQSQRSMGGVQQSNRSITDGMPDIHMVDSTFSLLSNMSSVDLNAKPRAGGQSSEDSSRIKAEMPADFIGVGSRRSLMSGLSRISDHSDVNSIFSDLSKKIGNVSTRSIAMSEISGIEEGFHESLGEESFAGGDPLSGLSTHSNFSAMDFDN